VTIFAIYGTAGTEIKNAEVGHFVESRRSDASEAPFRVRGRVTPRTIEVIIVQF
jgi:hypothetical protein